MTKTDMLENVTAEELAETLKEDLSFKKGQCKIKAYIDNICTHPKDRSYKVQRVYGGNLAISLIQGEQTIHFATADSFLKSAEIILKDHEVFLKYLNNL